MLPAELYVVIIVLTDMDYAGKLHLCYPVAYNLDLRNMYHVQRRLVLLDMHCKIMSYIYFYCIIFRILLWHK